MPRIMPCTISAFSEKDKSTLSGKKQKENNNKYRYSLFIMDFKFRGVLIKI